MDSVKVAVILGSSILILLFALLVFTKKPEKELYDRTVEMVMAHGGLTSAEEAMDYCPELKNVQRKMDRIQRLNSDIHGLTAGPAPNVSEDQSIEILATKDEIRVLRREVKKELTDLMEAYMRSQSTRVAAIGN